MSIIGALILLFIWGKMNPLWQLAIRFEIIRGQIRWGKRQKTSSQSDGVKLNSTFAPSSTDAPKARNSVPRNFWNRVVGVHEFDRSLAERCKPFLSEDYLPASPEHHRASLDSCRMIWD
jgi:hypothetical protein